MFSLSDSGNVDWNFDKGLCFRLLKREIPWKTEKIIP